MPCYLNSYDWSYFSGTKYGEYNNWHFLAPAGNEVLKKTIQQVVSNIDYCQHYNNGEYSVLALTGPIMFSRIIEQYGNSDNCKIYEPSLNNHVRYKIVNHKTSKNHYSKIKNKNILNKMKLSIFNSKLLKSTNDTLMFSLEGEMKLCKVVDKYMMEIRVVVFKNEG